MVKAKKILLLVSIVLLVSGCAYNAVNKKDPYEKFNRSMFAFNMFVDKGFVRPVTSFYTTVTPPPLQKGVRNFFSNIGEVSTVANDLLQFKLKQAVADSWRFIFNSTLGIGGLVDVATPLGLKKNRQDFGMTLAYWGVKNSPYLVLPFLGPSTFRDALGLATDYYLLSPYPYIHPRSLRYSLLGLDIISIRAEFMPANKLIDKAFDPYVFVRNAYMQRRAHLMKHKYPNGPKKVDYLLDAES